MVPYAVGAENVMHVLFVLHVCMLRECDGDGNAGVGSGRGVVAVSAYMGGIRGSGVLSSAGDVLEMSVVRGVGRVCGMCLARGGVLGVGGERIGFGLFWRNLWKVGYVCVLAVWVGGFGQGILLCLDSLC